MSTTLERFVKLHLYKKVDFVAFTLALKAINSKYKPDFKPFPKPLNEKGKLSAQLLSYSTFMNYAQKEVNSMGESGNKFTKNNDLKNIIATKIYPAVYADYEEVKTLKKKYFSTSLPFSEVKTAFKGMFGN